MKKQQLCLLALFSVILFIQGNCEKCEISSIQILQTTVARSSENLDTVFEVEVKNMCSCTIKSVFIITNGFTSSVMVDPKLFRQEGDSYVVNDGKAIASQSSMKFRYSWDHYFKMTVTSFQADC